MTKKEKTKEVKTKEKTKEEESHWLESDFDGQLAIDVYQTPENIVIKSAIAGVQPEDIDVTVNNDMVTIRGLRKQDEEINSNDYFFQECYWGGFSRSIVLPIDIDADNVKATIKNGVLTVLLPKVKKDAAKKVEVDEIEEEENEEEKK